MDIEKLKEVLTKAVMVIEYRAGDVSTEDGTYATTDTDEIIRLESALCDALGTEFDDIDLSEALALIDALPDYKSERDALLAEREQLLAQPPKMFVKFDASGEFVTCRLNKHGMVFDCDASYVPYWDQAVPAQQVKEHSGTNEYGLDVGYMAGKLNLFLRDIDRHTPDEAARVLARLAKVADEKVLAEPEFLQPSPAVAVPENWRIVEKKTCYALMCGNEVIATMAGTEAQENAATIAKLLSSPRITEQDAREILKAWLHVDPWDFNKWIDADGRALLNKLNAKQEGNQS
jgi:hypothetical protein